MPRLTAAPRVLAMVVTIAALATFAPAALAADDPFAGTSIWIAQVPSGVSPAQLAAQARVAGARTLIVKAADGTVAESQFTPALLAGLRAAGTGVCAWTFAYGAEPQAEAQATVGAVAAGARCLVVDAEGAYDGRYAAAQQFVRSLRAALGGAFPIALAGQAEVLEHPSFPYSVFLGPGGFGWDMPQVYWQDLGLPARRALALALTENVLYGRPVVPVGQLYGSPPGGEVLGFRTLADTDGTSGTSWFDLESAVPEGLSALGEPLPRLRHRAIAAMTLRPGADGDEIDWAQELLNASGAHLPVGGFYGARTEAAVARFQHAHHLRADGLLSGPTWRALLRLHPHEPSWAPGPPPSALVSAGG